MSIGHHFYSKRVAYVILGLLCAFGVACFAQAGKKKDKGLRALAVVELPVDAKSGARLVPIAILANGRFWDAGAYMADPRPLALDPGNVYEVERNGEPVGTFTVADARETNEQWIALGQWEPQTAKPVDKKPEAQKPSSPANANDDERPVLHRSPGSSSSAPVESRTSSSAPSAPAQKTAEREPDDPNRPVLRRGKPKSEQQESSFETANSPKPAAPLPTTPFKTREVLAAISDAGGPEPHAYKYAASLEEQQKFQQAVTDIARAELAAYVKRTPGVRFTPSKNFDQVSVRIFDLHYDNYPEVVLTARIPGEAPAPTHGRDLRQPPPAGDFYFYVTVVGQTDLYGQMRKLFSSVTDSQHLDAFPRMELIDGVDAEGSGRGDLLFRAYAGANPSYQVYHVGPDSLRKLFDSGGNY